MAALLPPSSRNTFFTVVAPHSMTRRPVAVEPVKVTMSTRGSRTNASPTSGSEEATMLSTPGGRSVAAVAIRPRWVADHGVSGAGFSTTAQPAASAAPILVMLSSSGAFHGVMAPTTPMASRRRMRRWGRPRKLTSAIGCSYTAVSAFRAQYSSMSIGSSTCMKGVRAIGAPASRTTIERSCSFSATRPACSWRRQRARNAASVAQPVASKARRAAAIAACRSVTVPSAVVPSTSPVAGLMFGKRAPDTDSTSRPSIRCRVSGERSGSGIVLLNSG
jgi:hypothetical protein